jgi:hypothetical protein
MMPGMYCGAKRSASLLTVGWGWCCWFDRRKTYAEDGQENVDQQVGVAPALKEDTQGRENDGKDDLADVAGVVKSRRLVGCRGVR